MELVKVLYIVEKNVYVNNGCKYIPLPKEMADHANIIEEDAISVALLLGKDGIHVGAWNHQNQPQKLPNEI